MITLEEVAKNINLASIPAIDEIGNQIAELWKESRESNAATKTPDTMSIFLKEITTLWNRLTNDTVEKSTTHSDSIWGETTTQLVATATKSISSLQSVQQNNQTSEQVLSSSENTVREFAAQAKVSEVVEYLSESMNNAYSTVSSMYEAVKSELLPSTSTDVSSSEAFASNSESLSSFEKIRETLTNALGLESQQNAYSTQLITNLPVHTQSTLFNSLLQPESALLSQSAVNYGGDSFANAPTNITMSGITITVNGNDGESVANTIANNLAAKTQQAYMGDGSVGR